MERKLAIKGPYALPPKPLTKPKPPKLTSHQLKKQSNLQSYAKEVQNTLKNISPSSNARQSPVQHVNTADNLNQYW
jgi:hypothetical protein